MNNKICKLILSIIFLVTPLLKANALSEGAYVSEDSSRGNERYLFIRKLKGSETDYVLVDWKRSVTYNYYSNDIDLSFYYLREKNGRFELTRSKPYYPDSVYRDQDRDYYEDYRCIDKEDESENGTAGTAFEQYLDVLNTHLLNHKRYACNKGMRISLKENSKTTLTYGKIKFKKDDHYEWVNWTPGQYKYSRSRSYTTIEVEKFNRYLQEGVINDPRYGGAVKVRRQYDGIYMLDDGDPLLFVRQKSHWPRKDRLLMLSDRHGDRELSAEWVSN